MSNGTEQPDIELMAKSFPDAFAHIISGGKWTAYPWIQYLSRRITPALIKGGGRFIITAPPQHGKSQFFSNWVPTWYLNRFQDRRVILASYALDYAMKWGQIVRENLMENPLAAVPMRVDTLSKKRFATKAGGQMITAGIGGPITGESAELFIIDDPVKNYEEAMSETIQERNINWYRSVARTRLQMNATIILMQTRWTDSDLAGLLEEEGGFEVINLPALCDDPDTDPLGRKMGEALCADRFDAATLSAIKKDVGEIIWSAMYQQQPVGKGGNIVKGEWIKYYDEIKADDMDEVAIFADLTYKDGEENDFTVIEAWGRRGPNIYLIDQIRARMGFSDQIKNLVRMIEAYPTAFHKEIEEKANGAAVIETIKSAVPGICANNPKTSKEARLAVVSPLYESGSVFYPNPEKCPWVKENIKELTKFPKAKHDDTVDVASMAVLYLGRVTNAMKRLEALNRW